MRSFISAAAVAASILVAGGAAAQPLQVAQVDREIAVSWGAPAVPTHTARQRVGADLPNFLARSIGDPQPRAKRPADVPQREQAARPAA